MDADPAPADDRPPDAVALPDATLSTTYLEAAMEGLLDVAASAGEHLNTRPAGEGTNSVAALIVHCCAVCEFWLGHVALGRSSGRERDSEFAARADLDELRTLSRRAVEQASADLVALSAGRGRPSEIRQFATGGGSDAAVVQYVLRELHVHLGHAELARDTLLVGPAAQ